MCQVIRHSCCSKSSFSEQVDRLLSVCNQRLYLLSQLRKQGLADKCSGIVYDALVVGKVLYALSGWGGYVSQTQKDRIDASFRKACKWRLTSKLYNYMSYFLKLIENCLLVVKPTVTACITCCRLVVRLFRLHCDLGDTTMMSPE